MVHIAAEADFIGEAEAAKRHGISARTVRRYRDRVAKSPELAQDVKLKKIAMSEKWIDSAGQFLDSAIAKLKELVDSSTGPEHIHPVSGAIKIVGELKLGASVLHDPSGNEVAKPEEEAGKAEG